MATSPFRDARPRVLFVYPHPSPFILQDRGLLAKHADVLEFRWFEYARPARALAKWMVRHRGDVDLAFVWFGDAHASATVRITRALGKPSVIVVGGYDVSDVPGYGYLSTRVGLRRARRHFRQTTRILAVSTTLEAELLRRFPQAAGKTTVLPTGVDADRFRPGTDQSRRVLAIAAVTSWPRAWIKGLDRVADVARLLSEVPFVLVGPSPDVASRLHAPPNLEVKGFVTQPDLLGEYQAAAAFLQPSRSEGMPNTVMEAMACGCVPVVTRVGGMPELVGDTGFVVDEDSDDLAEAVRRALDAPEKGHAARERILTNFSLARREAGLVRVVEELAG